MIVVLCRVKELSKKLSQQSDVAAELKRNLEAEAALHTQNVSCNLQPNRAFCGELGYVMCNSLEDSISNVVIWLCLRSLVSQYHKGTV